MNSFSRFKFSVYPLSFYWLAGGRVALCLGLPLWRPRLRQSHSWGASITLGIVCWCLVGLRPLAAQLTQVDPGALAMMSALEDSVVQAIADAERSVVAIARVSSQQAPVAQVDPLQLGNSFPFQNTPDDPDFVPQFFGSGVVVSDDGFIVTCAHVLDDPRRNEYYVWLDKQSYPARVVGLTAKVMASDPFSDLAVLKIDATNLRPAVFSRTELRKGQFVIALGNPHAIARDGQASASFGIISNLKRMAPGEGESFAGAKETIHQFGTLIQTDAKLNLGTSGGALVNLKGELVGLTSSLAATTGFESSAGFAIAVDPLFERVLEALKRGKLPEYGFLGIQPEELRSVDRERGVTGAKVSVVIPGLPGEVAGLQPEDVIFQVNDTRIRNRNDLFRELSLAAAGENVELGVLRPRTGRSSPLVLTLMASMSKKLVASTRPSYALHSPPVWRGMVVEYATAVPSELTRGGMLAGRQGAPKLAVLSVEPDTPAWNAGLRPGYGILSVNRQAVESPDEFYQQVADANSEVTLTVIRAEQRSEAITVAANPAEPVEQ